MKHKLFDFPDADFVIKVKCPNANNCITHYSVHRQVMEVASPVFYKMISALDPMGKAGSLTLEVEERLDHVWPLFLGCVYNRAEIIGDDSVDGLAMDADGKLHLPTMLGLLHLANKYELHTLKHLCVWRLM